MFANIVFGADHTVYSTTTTRRYRHGTSLFTEDGRHYHYTENGAVAIGSATLSLGGRIIQSAVPSANHDNQAVAAAAAVGARTVNVTLGASAAADLFAFGYLAVNDSGTDATAEGYIYHVESSSAATEVVFTLYPPGLRTALTTLSEVNAVLNPYKLVVIQASPPTAPVVGCTPAQWAASVFGWAQSRGPASVLTDGTVVIGESVMPSNAVDGAVEDWGLAEAAPPTEIGMVVGKVMVVAANTEYSTIWLMID